MHYFTIYLRFFKGKRKFPWRGRGSLFQREAKFSPWRGGSLLGGPRGDSESPPLGPSKPPITPLKRPLRGLAAPGAEPPPQRSAKGWLNLPAKRGKIEERALIQRHCASIRALAFILPCPARQTPIAGSGANVNPKTAGGGRGGLEGPRGRYYGNLPLAPP